MLPSSEFLFSTFKVTTQVFHSTPLSYALVNLKPIKPGHVLVVPRRVVPRLSELSAEEISDLFLTAQRVSSVVEKVYKGAAMTLACQDGKAAGQSVPHVHIHLMPRNATDFGGNNDDVYPALETHEEDLSDNLKKHLENMNGDKPKSGKFRVDADEDRKPRSDEEMRLEADWLRGFF